MFGSQPLGLDATHLRSLVCLQPLFSHGECPPFAFERAGAGPPPLWGIGENGGFVILLSSSSFALHSPRGTKPLLKPSLLSTSYSSRASQAELSSRAMATAVAVTNIPFSASQPDVERALRATHLSHVSQAVAHQSPRRAAVRNRTV